MITEQRFTIEQQYLNRLRAIKQRDVEVLLKKEYRGIWETAIKKYSDSAHFVYELLQNADDAKATRAQFILHQDGLWFIHNGTVRFTISDPQEDGNPETGGLGHINAITSIGNSTKIDEQKIGKFGIGFKAVFAYTATPHIYDDHFSFKLENYIVPNPIGAAAFPRKLGETAFYFPFDLPTKSKKDAYADIEEKLDSLFQPVLFLSHLEKIAWRTSERQGVYAKELVKTETYRAIKADLLEVLGAVDGTAHKEQLWLFSSSLDPNRFTSSHRVAVGFFVSANGQLETSPYHGAFCFFPTKEETKLGFLVQAPFLLTDSREGIKAGEPWNVDLVSALAELAADALCILKEIGIKDQTYLLNDTLPELITYREDDFPEVSNKTRISFKPFYTAILGKLKSAPLLPGRNGRYYATQKAYWPSDPELAELFSDEQIAQLMENTDAGWVFTSKGQKQLNQANKPLESYISSIVHEVLDPKKLLRRITATFVEAQTDEWLLKFYAYLGGRKFLWDDKEKLALKRPILLNQDRKATVPFDDDLTTPNIFLPTDRPTIHHTIYPPFTEVAEAMEFFKVLGLGQPDLRVEIIRGIIPLYSNGGNSPGTDLRRLHLGTFLAYFTSAPASGQADMVSRLRQINFLVARSGSKPGVRFGCQPHSVYFPSEPLKRYFTGCKDGYFLDEDFYADFLSGADRDNFILFLEALGVARIPRIDEVQPHVTPVVKERLGLHRYEVSITYSGSQFITDKQLHGLEEVLTAPLAMDLSVTIWNYLLAHLRSKAYVAASEVLQGTFKYVPKWNQSYRYEKFESSLITLLKKSRWLYDHEGTLKAIDELTGVTLHPVYHPDDPCAGALLQLLGVKHPDVDLNLSDEHKQSLALGRMLQEKGITREQLPELLALLQDSKFTVGRIADKGNTTGALSASNEIDVMLQKLKQGIRDRRLTEPRNPEVGNELLLPEGEEQDQDDFYQPSVNFQHKIAALRSQVEVDIEVLTRIEKLHETASTSPKYSYAWFKALLELEYMSSAESNSNGKQISIQFAKVEKEPGTERTLLLKHPNRYIPQSVEDIGDLSIKLCWGEVSKSVTVEVVSVKEYTLRAKLKLADDIVGMDLTQVSRVLIEVKNPVFILEELRKAFLQLELAEDWNLQQNLTQNIRFIFGPPGTGKTTYLAAQEIIPLMQQDEDLKVLVLAPTNKAADVLTQRIIDKMGGDESFHRWLVRFGTTADEALENNVLVVDKHFDIRTKPRNTTITTVARFAYDYFQPLPHEGRLHLKSLQWDYIIIDEASMVHVAAISYVLYQKRQAKFIIAGDPFQIQPISQVEQWKEENIYTMVQLDRFVNPVTVPHPYEIINLKKQYRSIPAIGKVFSHFTYDGILEHHRSGGDQKRLSVKGLAFKDINLIKFPVSRFESIYKPNKLNRSNYQVYSALFTVEFVNHLSRQVTATYEDKYKIGVICPYKAQATLVERVLAKQLEPSDRVEVTVGTIHGFQGDECDIIIALFNPPLRISKSPAMFLNKQNILNVSISRAKDYLFVLMPDNETEDVNNLYKIRKIEELIHRHAAGRTSVYDAETIEERLFGSKTYICDNSFATSHQPINVYAQPDKKYEVRCEETAVDVQIKS